LCLLLFWLVSVPPKEADIGERSVVQQDLDQLIAFLFQYSHRDVLAVALKAHFQIARRKLPGKVERIGCMSYTGRSSPVFSYTH
jgi:hypothetical protein